jgi:hypothetical protein
MTGAIRQQQFSCAKASAAIAVVSSRSGLVGGKNCKANGLCGRWPCEAVVLSEPDTIAPTALLEACKIYKMRLQGVAQMRYPDALPVDTSQIAGFR